MSAPRPPALEASDLRVELDDGAVVVGGVSLSVRAGEIVGLVGESGSGKTTIALALLGFARPGSRVTGGTVRVGGEAVDLRHERAARRLRGRVVSYVPQDPSTSLNPSLRIGRLIGDMLEAHAGERAGTEGVEAALRAVHLPSGAAFAGRYPHQLSGGQRQRVAIACALAAEPGLVVLDEPTTGLDVITQSRVLAEVARLRNERDVGMVYVSHDLAVVGQVADRLVVLYAGRVVEEGPTADVLARPRHPYTRGLVSSVPDHVVPRRPAAMPGVAAGVGEAPDGCAFAPRCAQRRPRCSDAVPPLEPLPGRHAVRCLFWSDTPPLVRGERLDVRPASDAGPALLEVDGLRAVHGRGLDQVVAASGVSFALGRERCLALVGESGSGKSTIARCVVGLHEPDAGRILLDGEPLPGRARDRTKEARRRVQIVFQDPYDSLNPRHRVGDAVARPARMLRDVDAGRVRGEVAALLEQVRLPSAVADRFPAELSGGERQRVAIARALAARPDVLVCDEITSALDVSVQAAVLDLLLGLRDELGLALVFITHDLGVVAAIADDVLVLERGEVRERGPVRQILGAPTSPYTRGLIDAAPRVPA